MRRHNKKVNKTKLFYNNGIYSRELKILRKNAMKEIPCEYTANHWGAPIPTHSHFPLRETRTNRIYLTRHYSRNSSKSTKTLAAIPRVKPSKIRELT